MPKSSRSLSDDCDDSGIVIPEYTKESMRIASIEWLYDVRKGWYLVRRLVDGKYQDLHVLNRQQALEWKNPSPKEYVLELKHFRS